MMYVDDDNELREKDDIKKADTDNAELINNDENSAKYRFCYYCGRPNEKLTKLCVYCGKNISEGWTLFEKDLDDLYKKHQVDFANSHELKDEAVCCGFPVRNTGNEKIGKNAVVSLISDEEKEKKPIKQKLRSIIKRHK